MNPQQMSQQRLSDLPSVPAELSSAESKLVYLYLESSNGCTLDDLQDCLDLKKISLYPVLDSLSKRGLVERDGQTYLPQSS